MTLDLTTSFGTERLEREVIRVFRRHLNTEIQLQMSVWSADDKDFAVEFDIPYNPVFLETIKEDNFYTGHRPSLIDAPFERYPNIAAISNRANPRPDLNSYDQGEVYDLTLAIEIMCRSDQANTLDDGRREAEVNSRTQRTSDAALKVLMQHKTLNGAFFQIGGTPNIRFTETFAGRESKGSGKKFLWKGARLELGATKLF